MDCAFPDALGEQANGPCQAKSDLSDLLNASYNPAIEWRDRRAARLRSLADEIEVSNVSAPTLHRCMHRARRAASFFEHLLRTGTTESTATIRRRSAEDIH